MLGSSAEGAEAGGAEAGGEATTLTFLELAEVAGAGGEGGRRRLLSTGERLRLIWSDVRPRILSDDRIASLKRRLLLFERSLALWWA